MGCAAVDNVPVNVDADTVVNPEIVLGNPTVNVPPDCDTVVSLAVGEIVIVPPRDIAEAVVPSVIEMDELFNDELGIAAVAIVVVPAEST